MRNLLHIVLSSLLLLLINSCGTPYYYCQIIETQPMSDEVVINEDYMIYDDENFSVIYNFWKKNGEAGFIFYNKGTENIYIHLDESFLIMNGIAHDYNQRVRTTSQTNIELYQVSYLANVFNSFFSISGTQGSAITNSVSTIENQIICVPPKSSKIISGYDILNTLYRSSKIYLNPRKEDIHSLSFSTDDSPFIFTNIIAYSIGDDTNLHRISNKFYTTKISNLPTKDITEKKEVVTTDYKNNVSVKVERVFKEKGGANMFYIPYQMSDFQ